MVKFSIHLNRRVFIMVLLMAWRLALGRRARAGFTSLVCQIKIPADNILNKIFFLFFPENWLRHFMQIVSSGDNLHEMPKPIF